MIEKIEKYKNLTLIKPVKYIHSHRSDEEEELKQARRNENRDITDTEEIRKKYENIHNSMTTMFESLI